MGYPEILSSYIEKSGLSLGEISLRLKNYGVSADRSYISKLRNGVKPPASDDLNEALAKVLGQEPDDLLIAAYIDKAPPLVKSFLKNFDPEAIKQLKILGEKHPGSTVNIFGKNPPVIEESGEYKIIVKKSREILDSKINEGFKDGFKDDDPLIESTFKLLQQKFGNFIDFNENKEKILNMLKHQGVTSVISFLTSHRNDVVHSVVMPPNDLAPVNNFFRIPILGHIAAGEPIFATEHIEDYIDIPSPGDYDPDELFMLKVKGDSMIGSRIYEGDKVLVKMQPEVENGEIAVVNINGDEATLKKVKKLDNGQTLLIASNDKYDPILVNHEGARVIGKVIQVIFEP